jgi:hypothetical protein
MLDPEFEAFQAGQSQLPFPEGPILNQAPFPHTAYAPHQHLQQSGSPAWANDFQRMSLSNPAPQLQQQNQSQQSQQAQQDGWHQEFAQQRRQQMGVSSQNSLGYNVPLERLSSLAQMPQMSQGLYMPQNPQMYQSRPLALVPDQAQHQVQPTQADVFDEEAFARAFDEAAKSEFATEQSMGHDQSLELGQDVLLNRSAENLMGSDVPDTQNRIGADLIHDPDQPNLNETIQQNDPDALARTAGQLLNSVKDNQSDKFQNSTFLELMRQLRDKEVMVDGDKIVDVHTHSEPPQRNVGAGP